MDKVAASLHAKVTTGRCVHFDAHEVTARPNASSGGLSRIGGTNDSAAHRNGVETAPHHRNNGMRTHV